jgi:chromatin structure-remodeling complex protein RSC7
LTVLIYFSSNFNSLLSTFRAVNNNGVYDIYTNQLHYPAHMQHTHARWEEVSPPAEQTASSDSIDVENGLTHSATSTPTETSPATPPELLPSSTSDTTTKPLSSTTPFPTRLITPASFPKQTPYLYRNALTIDTVLAVPPTSTLGIPGPDGEDPWGLGPKGLVDVEEDLIQLLPAECRAAFEAARDEERKWKQSWGLESGIDGDGRRWEGRRGYTGV